MFSSLIASLSLLTLALAQNSSSNAALDVEAIEVHFQNAAIVPDLLATFDPSADMAVSFPSVGQIQPGQALTQDQVQLQPTVSIVPANDSVELGTNFTITMVDADVVGSDLTDGETRHWLLNDCDLKTSSGSNQTVDNSSASSITAYAGPAPASGSGAHRYVILLFQQNSDFTAPSSPAVNSGVEVFSLTDYITAANLGSPLAGMYFTVEVGTASSSVSATSAVETSTLPDASATASGSGSAASSSSSSGSSSSGALGKFEKLGTAAGAVAGLVAALVMA